MDFIMDSRLVYCLQNGLPLDIDVYDLAEWCCLAELGSLSMNNGNKPVRCLISHEASGADSVVTAMPGPSPRTKPPHVPSLKPSPSS